MVSEPTAETGGPNRTPRSEIRPAVSASRKKEPVLLLDLSTSMNWGAADEYGPEWPDPGSRRAIVIEALHGLVRVLEQKLAASLLREVLAEFVSLYSRPGTTNAKDLACLGSHDARSAGPSYGPHNGFWRGSHHNDRSRAGVHRRQPQRV